MREQKLVGDALAAESGDLDGNIEQLFADGGRFEIARDRNSREAERLALELRVDAIAGRAEEFVLGRFHVMEERGEVHNARHVRIVKLDEARRTEWFGHGGDRQGRGERTAVRGATIKFPSKAATP